MLYRKIASVIEEHLRSDSDRILLVDGARQVGKTYIIRYLGKKLFPNFIELNMVEDSIGDQLFLNTKTVEDFYLQVSMLAGDKMGKKEGLCTCRCLSICVFWLLHSGCAYASGVYPYIYIIP